MREPLDLRLAAASALIMTAAVLPAQARPDCTFSLRDVPAGAPTFRAYPVHTSERRSAVPIHIERHAPAWLFRTALRSEYRRGVPNFAGHYRIEGWGCGTGCLKWALVDVLTGRVFFDPAISVVGSLYAEPEPETDFGWLVYRPDSRLLITLGAANGNDEGVGYYRWDGRRFAQIAFFPMASICRYQPPQR